MTVTISARRKVEGVLQMKEILRTICAVCLAACLFLFLFLGLHWNLLFCVLLGVGSYFGFYFLFKPSRKLAGIRMESLDDEKGLEKLLTDAREDMNAIDAACKAIQKPEVLKDARALQDTGLRILDYLGKNPRKIKLARRFFTYYLDTAAKLLSRYVEFQNTGLSSPEVLGILEKTADALPVLNNAFEKQFTHLMEGELLDVEADLALLENMRKMEGGL